jgi:hypothetical protein
MTLARLVSVLHHDRLRLPSLREKFSSMSRANVGRQERAHRKELLKSVDKWKRSHPSE